MKQGMRLRTAPTLALSPQLQQALRLLHLSSLDLQQELQQMLADNPFLEQVEREEQEQTDLAYEPEMEEALAIENSTYTEELTSIPDTFSLLSDEAQSFATLRDHDDNWQEASNHTAASCLSSDTQDEWSKEAPALTLEQIWGEPGSQHSEEDADVASADCQPVSLYDHLHHQARDLRLDDCGSAALYCLIESLDEDGYLHDSLAELAQYLIAQKELPIDEAEEVMPELLHQFTVALRLLHTFDPPGIGARDLGECLRLQLRSLQITDGQPDWQLTREVALALCHQPMQYLARRDIKQLQKLTGFSAVQIKQAMPLIASLNPKPANRFATTEHNIIVPDILVRRNHDPASTQRQPWLIEINPAVLPKIRVHEVYASALRQHQGGTSDLLNQRLQEARWIVKNLQQRFETIVRVAQSIVMRQLHFFSDGPQAMQPLVLREIAQELNMHESTISRVTNGKYMSSPWGTFELKYFFSSSLESGNGETTSGTAVRALLQQLITEEPPGKPLSDTHLCELLHAQGIQCARRTVAKYREALQIPPAHVRRARQGS